MRDRTTPRRLIAVEGRVFDAHRRVGSVLLASIALHVATVAMFARHRAPAVPPIDPLAAARAAVDVFVDDARDAPANEAASGTS